MPDKPAPYMYKKLRVKDGIIKGLHLLYRYAVLKKPTQHLVTIARRQGEDRNYTDVDFLWASLHKEIRNLLVSRFLKNMVILNNRPNRPFGIAIVPSSCKVGDALSLAQCEIESLYVSQLAAERALKQYKEENTVHSVELTKEGTLEVRKDTGMTP